MTESRAGRADQRARVVFGAAAVAVDHVQHTARAGSVDDAMRRCAPDRRGRRVPGIAHRTSVISAYLRAAQPTGIIAVGRRRTPRDRSRSTDARAAPYPFPASRR
jgi:hypothetical protein